MKDESMIRGRRGKRHLAGLASEDSNTRDLYIAPDGLLWDRDGTQHQLWLLPVRGVSAFIVPR
ncbi:MAG: hypothetical protein GEEBNDBF_00764 [bacterium]|nr:hypothetical protein [bacterium]